MNTEVWSIFYASPRSLHVCYLLLRLTHNVTAFQVRGEKLNAALFNATSISGFSDVKEKKWSFVFFTFPLLQTFYDYLAFIGGKVDGKYIREEF